MPNSIPPVSRDAIKSQVFEAHQALRDAIDKSVKDITNDVRVLTVSNQVGGQVMEFPLYRGEWVQAQGGLRMMLIDDTNHCHKDECPLYCPPDEVLGHCMCSCTRVLASGNSRVQPHSHHYCEYIQVIQGVLIEHTTGSEFRVGDTVFYPAHQVHEPELRGLALVCWQPPLQKHQPDVADVMAEPSLPPGVVDETALVVGQPSVLPDGTAVG